MMGSVFATPCLLSLLIVPALLAAPVGDGDGPPRGRWSSGERPEGWHLLTSEHHQLQVQTEPALADLLARHLEALLPLYVAQLPGSSPRGPGKPVTVKLFARRSDMAAYDPEAGDDAYFDAGERELVAWDTGLILGQSSGAPPLVLPGDLAARLDPWDAARIRQLLLQVADDRQLDAAGLLGHEGWHRALADRFGSERALPAWLEEGLGDWFGAQRPLAEGDGRLLPIRADRLAATQAALANGTAPELIQLLALDRAEFYAQGARFYPWAELLSRYLMLHPDDATRQLVPRLLERLVREKDHRRATERVLGAALEAGLEAQFRGWVAGLSAPDPLDTLAREFGSLLPPDGLVGPEDWVEAFAVRQDLLGQSRVSTDGATDR